LRVLNALVLIASFASGCAKQQPVNVSLMSPQQKQYEGEIRPRFFELDHEKKGWIRVEITDGMRTIDDELHKGVEVPVAAAEVPKGHYDKVRFGYVLIHQPAPVAPSVPEVHGAISGERNPNEDMSGPSVSGERPHDAPPAEPVREEGEVILDQPFCLDGTDGQQIVVEITRDESSLGAAPRFTLKAPGC